MLKIFKKSTLIQKINLAIKKYFVSLQKTKNMRTYPDNEGSKANCSICLNTESLVQWLINHGYKLSSTYSEEERNMFTLDGTVYSSNNHYMKYNRKGEYDSLYGWFCADDIDMFKALTSLDSSSSELSVEEIISCYI